MNEHVQCQIKRDTNDIIRTEVDRYFNVNSIEINVYFLFSREKIPLLKRTSIDRNTKAGEMTIQMVKILFIRIIHFLFFQLEDMSEQAKEILQINLQINLIQLGEEKAKVTYSSIIFSQKEPVFRNLKFVRKNIQMDLIKSKFNYNVKFIEMKMIIHQKF